MSAPAAREPVPLFTPLRLRGIELPNRIMVSPMCQYSADDAVPGEWHFVHLASRAVGGAGLVMTEDTAVEPAGRITPHDLGLWNDEQERAFAHIARFIAARGAVPGIQLGHAGRKASHRRPWEGRAPLTTAEGGWPVVGPSPVPWRPGDLIPQPLTPTGITAVIDRFTRSAQRALRAGFQVLELHAAHGYLADSFLSPLSNRRTDAYGGSIDNRTRFLRELVTTVRTVWPHHLPLFVRLSCTEWVDGGWDLSHTIDLCRRLQELGVDLIDCSSGGNAARQQIKPSPGYQVPFARTVRTECRIATGAVGLLSDPREANHLIEAGEADLVVLGRVMLWNPYWPHHAAAVLGAGNRLPVQYERAWIHAPAPSTATPATGTAG
ncbi:NADH:flavin oxidoreductase/NADH oxidase [Dactylosporangium sp. CA-092794]|uniref:NADH:flavin oxidoreductase/NADH oxidase n=1 Tax=Dactylosporangium sp. CA-092794 TaxID=3239929 RepID=UPI003D8AB2DA